ncbi:MAG: methyltransferase domain-containing protein [Clostridium sp.]
MDKQTKWDSKYLAKEFSPGEPDRFLIDNIFLLSPGSVLDLASGDGRNSIYLAKKGFKVTAVDFSIEALKRLDKFANNEDASVTTALVDIEDPRKLSLLGKFNNIVISHYKVADDILKVIENMLYPGGKLIYHTFNENHHIKTGFNKNFCLQKYELQNKLKLNLDLYESVNGDPCNGDCDGYVFSK